MKDFTFTHQHVRKFTDAFRTKIIAREQPLPFTTFAAPGRITYAEAMRGRYRPAKEGTTYGPQWATHWFHVTGTIPKAWHGTEVLFLFESGAEGLVWEKGQPVQGVANVLWPGNTDGPIRPYYRLTRKARGGEKVDLHVEMACNGFWGYFSCPGAERLPQTYDLKRVRLVQFDREAWELWVRFDTLHRLAGALPHGSHDRAATLAVAYDMLKVCYADDRSTWKTARAIGDKFFNAKQRGTSFHLSAIPEAHMDIAWLWPVDETKRKCARAFSAQLKLMDEYPGHRFCVSQVIQFAWMKDLYPGLYARIKKRVKEGRMVPVGGSWLEPDSNMPNGESFARQLIWGQHFLRREFGMTAREFWQPDGFGFPASLPQIIRQGGMEYFFTTKLSWNETNLPVSTTFLWEGIDGSRVLAHIPEGGTMLEPERVISAVNSFKDHERAAESCIPYGFGDGGAGPTELMLERMPLMDSLPGLPSLTVRSASEFFDKAKADMKNPLVWNNELYFERHRATYTSQAAPKDGNRRMEVLLHDIEFLASVLHAQGRAPYPARELKALWYTTLLNQFHDILPGSSIKEVHDQTKEEYKQSIAAATALRDQLAGKLVRPAAKAGKRWRVINTLPFGRCEIVDTPNGPIRLSAPPMGVTVCEPTTSSDSMTAVVHRDGMSLENTLVRAEFDKGGRLVNFHDRRHDREVILPGARGNQFVIFEDDPLICDAWDVNYQHLDKAQPVGTLLSAKAVQKGNLSVSLVLSYRLTERSTLRQTITLNAHSPLLTFDCEADWDESHKFLKVEFPLNLRREYATYETQFGHIRRPTHFNTSWDWAKFEVAALRWGDLSESNYGVALLNNNKHGYSCLRSTLRLSLLRAPKDPDLTADIGHHAFKYALYPHPGDPGNSDVVQVAAAFQSPLSAVPTLAETLEQTFFDCSNPAIVLDTVKKAEDSNDVIVRLYESSGARQKAVLMTSLPLQAVCRTNFLEDDGSKVTGGSKVPLELGPFEIISIRFRRAGE